MNTSRRVAILVVVFLLIAATPASAVSEGESANQDTCISAFGTPLERDLFSLINDARRARDREPLVLCESLNEVAQAHARDMIERDCFSHRSPKSKTPGGRVRSAGISARRVGENLAGNTHVLGAHRQLMASRGHRFNLLSAHYDTVGLAVVPGGRYGKMIVQIFTGN